MNWYAIASALCVYLALWAILSADWGTAVAFAAAGLGWAIAADMAANLKREMRRRDGGRS